MQRHTASRILTGLLVFLFAASHAYACPMCKYGLVSVLNPNNVSRLSQGYFWSIILMLSVPAILITSMGILISRSRR